MPLAVSLLLFAGCGGGGTPPEAVEPAPDAGQAESEEVFETTIRVENRHWADVTVYVFRGAARARLGTVTTNAERTYRIPIGMSRSGAHDVILVAEAIGSDERYVTDRLAVLEGQEVLLRLEVRMVHSSASVFWP